MTPFHVALASYRARSGLSVQALAVRAAIRSTGHTHRLLTGHAKPSRDVVIRLALALALDVAQTDALLRAAGHAGLVESSPRPESPAVFGGAT